MKTLPEFQSLAIDRLDLDTENPRIRKWVEQYGDTPSFEQMLLALGAGSSDLESGSTVTFQSLKESIRAQGGISNPIIVQAKPDSRFRVVEGNTRVAIYQSFENDGLPGNWSHIPALVYSDLTTTDVEAIRLQCHIVGPRQWDPYSKAKYLDHLVNVRNLPMAQVVDLCGGRRREIVEYVEAFRDMEKFYRPLLENDSEFDPTRFSAFIELQKANVKASILDAGFTISDFAKWVAHRNIDPLNTVRAVPRILKHPQAKAKFLSVNAREALKILEVPPTPALSGVAFEQLVAALIERLDALPYQDVKALKKDPGGSLAQRLFQAKDSLLEICDEINSE